MVRGRKPKPSAAHEASGAYVKNPQRRNKREPVAPTGPLEMPNWVREDDIARQCWEQTVCIIGAMKILTQADLHPVAGYCSDFAQWFRLRAMIEQGNVSQMTEHGDKVKVEATQVHKYQDRMFKFWGEYGMTPSSRSRLIAAQAEDEEDNFEALLSRLGGGKN